MASDSLIGGGAQEQSGSGRRSGGRRGGGRAGNVRGKGAAISQPPWSLPVNTDKPTEPLNADGVQAVHNGAMRILEEIGIEFLNPNAVEILKKAGCIVAGENVRIGRELVLEQLTHAPERFTITPRNPL